MQLSKEDYLMSAQLDMCVQLPRVLFLQSYLPPNLPYTVVLHRHRRATLSCRTVVLDNRQAAGSDHVNCTLGSDSVVEP